MKERIKDKKEFPRDIEFVPGMGVFMEEFKTCLSKVNVFPEWIGIPGKSLRSKRPKSFDDVLEMLSKSI